MRTRRKKQYRILYSQMVRPAEARHKILKPHCGEEKVVLDFMDVKNGGKNWNFFCGDTRTHYRESQTLNVNFPQSDISKPVRWLNGSANTRCLWASPICVFWSALLYARGKRSPIFAKTKTIFNYVCRFIKTHHPMKHWTFSAGRKSLLPRLL